jgi:hypothetical protein
MSKSTHAAAYRPMSLNSWAVERVNDLPNYAIFPTHPLDLKVHSHTVNPPSKHPLSGPTSSLWPTSATVLARYDPLQ